MHGHPTRQGSTSPENRVTRVEFAGDGAVQSPVESSAPGVASTTPERGHYLYERCDVSERTCAQPATPDRVLRALPTEYAGHTFRSRTEARWAVFLDIAGIDWEYEREGFEFGGERYLPDFWLPSQERWLEVKGAAPTFDEQKKAQWLADGTGFDVLLVFGQHLCPDGATDADSMLILGTNVWDTNYWWCECPHCGYIDAQYMGRSARLRCRCVVARAPDEDKTYTYDTPRLCAAYDAARTAFTGAKWRP